MNPFIASIENSVRSFLVERRRAARRKVVCEVRLPVCVSMPNELIDPEADEYPEPLMGHTHDLSETGVSLVLPSARLGGRDIAAAGAPLRLVLTTPRRLLILRARTVRHERLAHEDGDQTVMIGARIEHIPAGDRTYFSEFLRSLV